MAGRLDRGDARLGGGHFPVNATRSTLRRARVRARWSNRRSSRRGGACTCSTPPSGKLRQLGSGNHRSGRRLRTRREPHRRRHRPRWRAICNHRPVGLTVALLDAATCNGSRPSRIPIAPGLGHTPERSRVSPTEDLVLTTPGADEPPGAARVQAQRRRGSAHACARDAARCRSRSCPTAPACSTKVGRRVQRVGFPDGRMMAVAMARRWRRTAIAGDGSVVAFPPRWTRPAARLESDCRRRVRVGVQRRKSNAADGVAVGRRPGGRGRRGQRSAVFRRGRRRSGDEPSRWARR